MKKILFYFIIASTIFAKTESNKINNVSELHSQILKNKGLESVRENILLNKVGIKGRSGSYQSLDFLKNLHSNNEKDFHSTGKGFLMSTNSNLVSNENFYSGVTLGYEKNRLNYGDDKLDKVRTYGVNYTFSYLYDGFLLSTGIGYDESKNITEGNFVSRDKIYNSLFELGKIYKIEKSVFYPFLRVDFSQINKGKSKYNDYNKFYTVKNSLGLYGSVLVNKFLFSFTGEWQHQLNSRRFEKDKGLNFSKDVFFVEGKLGYFYKEDLLINFGYKGYLNKYYNYDMLEFGFTHIF